MSASETTAGLFAVIAMILGLLLFSYSCTRGDYISPREVTNMKPTYIYGKWYQCKEVEVK